MDYHDFLSTKRFVAPAVGKEPGPIHPALFPFQADLTRWAVRKGRAALFATTGMGKTAMQLEWARQLGERTLILAPLAVAQQTVREGDKFGIAVTYARSQEQAAPEGITITNYEMLHHFDPRAFGAVVLDESGILKNFSGTVKRRIIAAFRGMPYKLSCTATPAPNDTIELCNQADFLEIMTPAEMVSTFFTPKGQDSAATLTRAVSEHATARGRAEGMLEGVREELWLSAKAYHEIVPTGVHQLWSGTWEDCPAPICQHTAAVWRDSAPKEEA